MLKLWKRKKQILQTEYTQQEVFFFRFFSYIFRPFLGAEGDDLPPAVSDRGPARVLSVFYCFFFSFYSFDFYS